MITTIEPKHHNEHPQQIDALLDLLKIYNGFELSLKGKSKTTFIIAHNRKNGTYGGAVFYPKTVETLHKKLKKEIEPVFPTSTKVWCSSLCFCLNSKEEYSDIEILAQRDLFYLDLYRIFCKLGKRNRTNCVVITLKKRDYENSVRRGHWIYILPEPLRGAKATPPLVTSILHLIDRKRVTFALEKPRNQKPQNALQNIYQDSSFLESKKVS